MLHAGAAMAGLLSALQPSGALSFDFLIAITGR